MGYYGVYNWLKMKPNHAFHQVVLRNTPYLCILHDKEFQMISFITAVKINVHKFHLHLKGYFSSGTEFEIIFEPLGSCIIFEIKYNFVILELIGQPYFDLKQNNSKNVLHKCLNNCFRIDSLSSNLNDKNICQYNIAFMWSLT